MVGVPRSGGSGGQIVSWRLLSSYAQLGTVDVLALARPGEDASPELRASAERFELVPLKHITYVHSRARNATLFARAVLRREPFRVAKFRSRPATRRLAAWLAETRYDAVHCDNLATAPYRDLVPETPAILAEHNVEWQQFSQLARPDLASRISVWRVPVDEVPMRPERSGPPTFVVLGSLRSIGRVHGLRWFLREVWGLLRDRVPNARLEVIGADPPSDIRARDGRSGIRVHGFVDDLEPLLRGAYGCVLPLFAGGGIRVKLLKLIGRGIPCVGTPVAMQGLTPLEGCVIASEPEEWVSVLTELAERPEELWEEARLGARRLRVEHSPRLEPRSSDGAASGGHEW
jgi:glycosyltransferase involved in cell wall biosynthesis